VKRTLEDLCLYIKSRYPIIYLVTPEEHRADRLVLTASESIKKDCFFWSLTEGFYNTDKFGKATEPYNALDTILKYTEPGIFVLKDFHPFLEEPLIVRKLRDIVSNLKKSYKTLIMISPVLVLPPGLEKGITPIDIPLPSSEELKQILINMIAPLKRANKITATLEPQLIEKVTNASLGLTESEVENLYAKLVVRDRTFDETDLPFVVSEKKKLIRSRVSLNTTTFPKVSILLAVWRNSKPGSSSVGWPSARRPGILACQRPRALCSWAYKDVVNLLPPRPRQHSGIFLC